MTNPYAGRRTSLTDALNHVTTFAYDKSGNRISVTDANQHTTPGAPSFRGFGERTTDFEGTSGVTTYDYDQVVKLQNLGFYPLGKRNLAPAHVHSNWNFVSFASRR